MTTVLSPSDTLPTVDRTEAGAHPFLPVSAGAALLAFPFVLLAATVTSPPQKSDSNSDYVASLGADPGLTGLSAGLFHYSWVLFALGVLATVGLVRGRRGRVATSVAALVTSFSAIQLSGLLLGDWYAAALARALPIDQATAVFDGATANPWVTTWLFSGQVVGFVGIPLIVGALARAGVVSWWLLAAPLAALVSLVALGAVLPSWGFAAALFLGATPMAVIGLRLIRRASSRVRRSEAA